MVLPAPGGPVSRRWWPPAAAVSRARRAQVEAADLGEVDGFVARRGFAVGEGGPVGPGGFALEAAAQLGEVGGGADVDAGDERGFGGVGGGDDDRGDAGAGEDVDEREGAGDGPDRSVEAELAEDADAVEHPGGELLVGERDPEPDRELEAGAGLAQAAGREVHRDALGRPRELRVRERGPDPLARLADRGVGQADDLVARQPAADVDLDRDEMPVDPDERGAGDGCEHRRPPRSTGAHVAAAPNRLGEEQSRKNGRGRTGGTSTEEIDARNVPKG